MPTPIQKYGGEDAKNNSSKTTVKTTPTAKPKPRPSSNMPTRPSNPAAEGNGQAAFNSNPNLLNIVTQAQSAGLNNGQIVGAVRQASPWITGQGAAPSPTLPMGPGPGGGGGGGAGSGGGGDPARQAAAVAAIQSLFQNYNRPADTAMMDNLNRITQQAQATGDQSMQNLMQMLGTYTNPYGGGQQSIPGAPAQAGQATGQPPLQALMQAMSGQPGVIPAGEGGAMGVGTPNPNQQQRVGGTASDVDAMRAAMGGMPSVPGVPDAYAQQAGGQWNQMLQASYNAQQQDRMNDARMSQTSFQQQLGNNNAAAQFQMTQQDKARRDQMMMSILQMAIDNGINLGEIGVTF